MKFKVNDYVMATEDSDYAGLKGVITEIDMESEETGNPTPDIYVDFKENPKTPLDTYYKHLNGTSIEQVIMCEDELRPLEMTNEETAEFLNNI